MSRFSVALTGLIGLVGATLLATVCFIIMAQGWLPVLVIRPIFVWGIWLFVTFFSIIEIPVMIVGIQRIAANANPKAKYVALLVNAGYVFFAAMYAAPFILLTGNLWLGAVLAALSLVRFVTAFIFLPQQLGFSDARQIES